MTCHYSGTAWSDVLYTSVRNTPGGVNDSARFLTERRGKTIHPETLRAKLRHIDGESISLEMVELLTEWMEEKAQAHRLDWLHSLNAQFGLATTSVQADDGMRDLKASFVQKTFSFGVLAGSISEALSDGKVSPAEAEKITIAAQENQRASQDIIESVRASVRKVDR